MEQDPPKSALIQSTADILSEGVPAPQTEESKTQDAYAARGAEILRQAQITAVNKASEKYNPRTEFEAWIREVGKNFIEAKLDAFPFWCDVARVQNLMKRRELEKYGNKGKFTDTYGWSQDGNSYFKFEIPRELYLFMVNLVYKDFWGHENQKVASEFMRRVCRGDDPMEVLKWVKIIYGSNQQEGIVA